MGLFDRYRRPDDLAQRIPVFPLAGALLLPRADLPLNIFEPRYLAMVDHALSTDRLIGMIQPDAGDEAGEVPALMKVGCVGRITSWSETPDDRMLVTLTGVSRFLVVDELDTDTPFRQVIANYHPFAADLAKWVRRPPRFWSIRFRCSPPIPHRRSRPCSRRLISRRAPTCWWR